MMGYVSCFSDCTGHVFLLNKIEYQMCSYTLQWSTCMPPDKRATEIAGELLRKRTNQPSKYETGEWKYCLMETPGTACIKSSCKVQLSHPCSLFDYPHETPATTLNLGGHRQCPKPDDMAAAPEQL